MVGNRSFFTNVEITKYNFDSNKVPEAVLQDALVKGIQNIGNQIQNYLIVNPHLEVESNDDTMSEILFARKGLRKTKQAIVQVAQNVNFKLKEEVE